MLKCKNGCLILSCYDLYFFSLEIKVLFLNKKVLLRKPILNIYFSFANWYKKLVSVGTPNSGFHLKHTAYGWKLYNCWQNYTIRLCLA